MLHYVKGGLGGEAPQKKWNKSYKIQTPHKHGNYKIYYHIYQSDWLLYIITGYYA